eukprot:CAMPEP_0185026410 /NCGR_PEP_ID=MMETSP1103-20130426/10552_1 /TAXON_ID=36769 /ORGANISM="Paraphysomonas bandaiensis, Strain Caron Lab Isolate" /LENGTH=432 /DNA_ID=CAMNT_0027559979 /DNA_START=177 /DNA_END=1475 /DNA_ORIENTATION=-
MTVRMVSLCEDKESINHLDSIVTEAGGVLAGNEASKYDAVVCDARGLTRAAQLNLLYSRLNPLLPKLSKSGRLVLLGGDGGFSSNVAEASAVGSGVGGFTKAMALELGSKGIAANAIRVPSSMPLTCSATGCGVVQFLLSKRSAFITGQVLQLNSAMAEEDTPVENPITTPRIHDSHPSPASYFSVQGSRVIVTGAARGIGECTARLFAAEGANVLLVDHPSMSTTLEALASELGMDCLSMDVTVDDAPDVLYEGIKRTFEGSQIDVMVHNAGITRDKTFLKMTYDQFKQVVDVNLNAIVRIDDMLLSRSKGALTDGARMVYLSSIAGIAGGFGQSNYSCTKAAIMGYVSSLSKEVAIRGIGVNAVAPGFIETEMTKVVPFAVRNIGRRMNALSQGGYPVDIAEAILFLSCQASRGISGSTIRVCGMNRIGA